MWSVKWGMGRELMMIKKINNLKLPKLFKTLVNSAISKT
jgi:hypothetical protein